MINLFYMFDKASLELYQSFRTTRLSATSVVIEDTGYLPNDVKSPYMFFANYKVEHNARPKFFNEINIPEYWEIHGSNDMAHVYNLGEKKANIIYHPHPQLRSVHKVEWLDNERSVRFIDIYNQYGHRFSQEIFNAEGKRVFKLYFNQNNEEIIYENIVTNQIILKWNGKEYIFSSKTDFVHFYLEQSGLDYSIMNINSLGIPFFTATRLGSGHTNLIWQEEVKDEIPGNMISMLTAYKNRTYKVLVPSHQEYDKLTAMMREDLIQYVKPFGYVYEFVRKHQYSNDVLIATNSDQLLHFEEIVKSCPELTFHIVAITEMSNTLIQYDKYHNVKLYPKANKATFNQLFNVCDIYLDINKGNELHNAVRKAFHSNMIIYSFKECAHNLSVTIRQHIFEADKINELTHHLSNLDNSKRDELLLLQHEHANHIKVNTFVHAFK